MLSKKELQSIAFIAACTVAALVFVDKLHFLSSVSVTAPVIESPSSVVNIPRLQKIAQLHVRLIEEKLTTLNELHVQKVSVEQTNFNKLPIKNNKDGFLTNSVICDNSVHEKYSAPDLASTAESLKWCKDTIIRDRVVIGRSWGSMSKTSQMHWDKIKCNELLSRGKLQTCDERWGWKSFDDWRQEEKLIVSGVSNVSCVVNIKTSTYCQHDDILVDFSALGTQGPSRTFDEGFITTFGTRHTHSIYPQYAGFKHVQVDDLAAASFDMKQRCDEVETRPTFILSNDDIYNMGHYFNDVVGMWSMLTLADKDSQKALLINIDGIRQGGPAGGPSHRLMESSDPDRHGPYAATFESWFGEVRRGVDYAKKKVCFKQIYFPQVPGMPWFWNDWGQINDCSVLAASPLYQSFNVFARQSWLDKYGPKSLVFPPTDAVHVVIEVRAINPTKRNNHSSARHITNLEALVAALETIPGVKVTTQDFAKLKYEEQVSLSHSASIFMSMHGAGTTHIFHAAIGSPNCCALVELFPDTSIDFYTAQGYGNIARMLGMHHYRNVAEKGTTNVKGTRVSVEKIKALVQQAADAVRTKPTCLHEVRDTRQGVYGRNNSGGFN